MTDLSTNPSESEVRAMFDAVYPGCISDNDWEDCKSNWMRPDQIQWLKERIENRKQRR